MIRRKPLWEAFSEEVRREVRAAEAIELFRNVLEDSFDKSLADDYQVLSDYLSLRPYAVRIAAGFLREAPDYTPRRLLEILQSGNAPEVDDTFSFAHLERLLHHCLEQLEFAHPLSRSLLDALAVCSDKSMKKERFVEWQTRHHEEDEVDRAIRRAHACGLLLMQSGRDAADRSTFDLRLHTDVQRQLRKTGLLDPGHSLSDYLDKELKKPIEGRPVDPGLQVHLWSLFQLFHDHDAFMDTLIDD